MKSKPEMIPLFEYFDLPEYVIKYLQSYYSGTDRRIPNDSYSIFPDLTDLDEGLKEGWFKMEDPAIAWIIDQVGSVPRAVMIHWDW